MNACAKPKEIIISDFCSVYKPFPQIVNEELLKYWNITEDEIARKKAKNINLTPQEVFFEVFVTNVARNEERYNRKKCNANTSNNN